MRKVVAASLLGTATQEPSLLKQTFTLEEYRSSKYADRGTLVPNQINKLCRKKKRRLSPNGLRPANSATNAELKVGIVE